VFFENGESTSLNAHEEYLSTVDATARARLERVQHEVERRIPDAVRCISYKMPAFRQKRVFFYFAAFKKHIGIYPPITQDEALILETARHRGPKGNLSFAHDEPLPLDLIGRVAVALAAQYASTAK
jgi:uncharacterized protein YdhG (YjbR/CyaY superfamily)